MYYKHPKDYHISGSAQLDSASVIISTFELLKPRTLKIKLEAVQTSTALTQDKHQEWLLVRTCKGHKTGKRHIKL